MRFQISTRLDDVTTNLVVVGEIDLASAPQLTLSISAALEANGAECLVVDLTDVTFLDCAGIAALVRGTQLAHKHGRAYRWQGAQGMPLAVLELFGLTPTP